LPSIGLRGEHGSLASSSLPPDGRPRQGTMPKEPMDDIAAADAEAIAALDRKPPGPTFDPDRARALKPPAKDVVVIAPGSHSVRYGFANASSPKKVRTIAAFPRRAGATSPPVRAAGCNRTADVTAKDAPHAGAFDAAVDDIAADAELHERRRGGGKPIPWDVQVEAVDVPPLPEDGAEEAGTAVVVGRGAERLLYGAEAERRKYDIVAPIADGRVAWDPQCSNSLVRAALDAVLRHIAVQLLGDAGKGAVAGGGGARECLTHVVLIVPDSSDRADVAEFVSALHRVDELRLAAVFVHHSSVSCALGAGLSTCAVVDIGYSTTTIACVEEGCVLGDSRLHLQYGSQPMVAAFERLVRRSGAFDHVVDEAGAGDVRLLVARTCEQLCTFNAAENDTLSIVMARAPSSGKMYRVKCGAGVRSVPAYGLVHPKLFEAVTAMCGLPRTRIAKPVVNRNADEDNFLAGLFDDIKRSATVMAAVPFGVFANESPEALRDGRSAVNPVLASLVDAIIWSVNRAVESSTLTQSDSHRGPELRRRYFNSVLLAGGGSSVDGIGLTLEGKIKRALVQRGVDAGDVTIIDGAKGRSDEELLAAAASVKSDGNAGIDDDGDPACLPWKGGAVMVEADAVRDGWLFRDEWDSRGVRALRERVPFYW
jgi:actin-related protein